MTDGEITENFAERIASAKECWEEHTTPEDFYFEAFKKTPFPLRRHKEIKGGLAELKFAHERNPEGIWLSMIVADVAGDASNLLSWIVNLADKFGLTIAGEVNPMRPLNWAAGRTWPRKADQLLEWYKKRNFRDVSNGAIRRIEYP